MNIGFPHLLGTRVPKFYESMYVLEALLSVGFGQVPIVFNQSSSWKILELPIDI